MKQPRCFWLVAVLASVSPLTATPTYANGKSKPTAKESVANAYYEGLIKLHLFDLLEYELRQHPPADPLAESLLRRRMQQTIAAEATLDPAQRRQALAKANDILADLIRRHGTDSRVLDWQMDLARSLIYEQGEPYYSAILYRGGTLADREKLAAIMRRAKETLIRLRDYLDTEYARIDELSLAAYERLDKRGYVTKIEEAMPQAEYMLQWANFYAALAMNDDSQERRSLLEGILANFARQPAYLKEPHAQTHVQAQSLLLAGMASRRLADFESAERLLEDAADVARNVANPEERRDLDWIRTLAAIEQVRALRDTRRYSEAVKRLAELRQRLGGRHADFGHRLVLALLQASLAQARTMPLHHSDVDALDAPLTDEAVRPLEKLADADPSSRDQVYAALYDRIRDYQPAEKLHPFQQSALIAGHLAEATRLRHGDPRSSAKPTAVETRQAEARAVALLDAAIALARKLVENPESLPDGLRCEVAYNLGVALHLRGRRIDAANRFVEVTETCPRFVRALPAATYAVEIAAQLTEDPSLRTRKDVQVLLVRALRTLVEGFPESPAAGYWRFFYAQALEDTGAVDEAVKNYALVTEDHPQFLTARFRAARGMIASLEAFATDHPEERTQIVRRAGEGRRAIRHFQKLAAQRDEPGAPRFVAEADVLLAEMDVLPGVARPDETLSVLEGFERKYPEFRDLIGRALRARIVAYEASGRLDDARQAVPRYIASAPHEAGATLQALFDATWAEVVRYHESGRDARAAKKAQAALLFAKQLFDWAQQQSPPLANAEQRVLRVQLAEAYLEAGNPQKALPHFKRAAEEDAATHNDHQPHHPRIVLGYARTLQQLKRYADALPLFNRAFREAPETDSHRFRALLGDLTCRTELGEPAADLIAVIRQQRFLHPDMGGKQLKARFAELQRRNEKRR